MRDLRYRHRSVKGEHIKTDFKFFNFRFKSQINWKKKLKNKNKNSKFRSVILVEAYLRQFELKDERLKILPTTQRLPEETGMWVMPLLEWLSWRARKEKKEEIFCD